MRGQFILAGALLFLTAQASAMSCEERVLNHKPEQIETHGQARIDNYFWLRERNSAEVMDLITKENENTTQQLSDTIPLQIKLNFELRSRLPEQEDSFPVMNGEYQEWWSQGRGDEYPVLVRHRKGITETMVDANELAKGKPYLEIHTQAMSPDDRYVAFSEDDLGMRLYTIHVHDVMSNRDFAHAVHNTSGEFVWADDSKSIFYIEKDSVTLRPNRLFKWTLGGEHRLIYEEKDPESVLEVTRNGSGNFLQLTSRNRDSSEVRILRADNTEGEWVIYKAREPGLIYELDEAGDRFIIRTNWKAPEYRVMTAGLEPTAKEHWHEMIPERKGVTIRKVLAYEKYLLITEWEDGLPHMRVVNRANKVSWRIKLPRDNAVYSLEAHALPDYKTESLRFFYSSFNVPLTEYDYYPKMDKVRPLSREYAGEFDLDQLEVRREWATAADGSQIPVSIMMKKGTELNGKNPLLLQAYGSYADTDNVAESFRRDLISLVERGFVIAYAHVRGGSELGMTWYEEGRLDKKENTFTDFISAAEFLLEKGYTTTPHLYAFGESAGGMLLGTVANMRPDLFRGMILDYPFVDVLTTMLDEDLPLTTLEYKEWGNPNDPEDYQRILKYSPYDNISAQAYPNIFVTAAIQDSQVPYWEPVKWAQKLRDMKTDGNLLILRTYLNSGHNGPSGRTAELGKTAEQLAFLLKLEGITN